MTQCGRELTRLLHWAYPTHGWNMFRHNPGAAAEASKATRMYCDEKTGVWWLAHMREHVRQILTLADSVVTWSSISKISNDAYYFSLQEHYIFCHDTLADFLDSFDTYANFKDLGDGQRWEKFGNYYNCCKKNKLYFSFIHVLSYCIFLYCYTHNIFKVLWTWGLKTECGVTFTCLIRLGLCTYIIIDSFLYRMLSQFLAVCV